MLHRIKNLGRFPWYWHSLIAFGVASIVIALVYQYVLDYRPCVLCIHVRLWVVAYIAVAIFALFVTRSWKATLLAHTATTMIMAILLERSYLLLGTERGWVFGACDFDLGLPDWLMIEEWFPGLFKVWEPCGYTPEMLFHITMAETLVATYACLTVISTLMTISCYLDRHSGRK